MKIERITVSAGRTFNHPHESYSNLKPFITLEATLIEGDDPEACVKELQGKAERMVEDHKTNMLASLNSLYEAEQINGQILSMESELKRAQSRLEQLRSRQRALPIPDMNSCDGVPCSLCDKHDGCEERDDT
jgi:DNA repair exonuclease SbcCD ATPase subunit